MDVAGSRLAVIPARGGSQRIPRKNIRDFLGVPALTRVVEMLRHSGLTDRIVVSTDDDEIADVALAAGAEVPFFRPADLADSYTGARPVIQHAIAELNLTDTDTVGVFYATALLLTLEDVAASAALFDEGDCDFVMAVGEFPAPIERALEVDEAGAVFPRYPAHILARSQDLARSYRDLGQFYWGKVRSWRTPTPVVQARCRSFYIDPWRAIDIDTPEDWRRAELLFKVLHA